MTHPAAAAGKGGGVEGYIARLHDKIGITAAEEPKWSAVADIYRANAKAMKDLRAQYGKNRTGETAVDRLKAQQAYAGARQDYLNHLLPAVQDLYTVLTPAQQAIADQALSPTRNKRQGKKKSSDAMAP